MGDKKPQYHYVRVDDVSGIDAAIEKMNRLGAEGYRIVWVPNCYAVIMEKATGDDVLARSIGRLASGVSMLR